MGNVFVYFYASVEELLQPSLDLFGDVVICCLNPYIHVESVPIPNDSVKSRGIWSLALCQESVWQGTSVKQVAGAQARLSSRELALWTEPIRWVQPSYLLLLLYFLDKSWLYLEELGQKS